MSRKLLIIMCIFALAGVLFVLRWISISEAKLHIDIKSLFRHKDMGVAAEHNDTNVDMDLHKVIGVYKDKDVHKDIGMHEDLDVDNYPNVHRDMGIHRHRS